MKLLLRYRGSKFSCPAIPNVGKVPVTFVFYVSVQTDSVDRFKNPCSNEIVDLCRIFKKFLSDVLCK